MQSVTVMMGMVVQCHHDDGMVEVSPNDGDGGTECHHDDWDGGQCHHDD